jgi:nicotinate-nucleotide adenylyltransferase
MKRLGIFGGTFDPPHIAHSILADDVREQMNLDKIIFIPSGNPPLKEFMDVSSPSHRFNMTKLAFEKDPCFEVNGIELIENEGKTYTVNTLLKLKKYFKNEDVKFFLIIGKDNLIDFPKWKNPEKIFSLCEVLVMNRPEHPTREVKLEFFSKVKFIKVPMLAISSTMIRNYVRNNKSIKYLVNSEVEDYINNNKLYL